MRIAADFDPTAPAYSYDETGYDLEEDMEDDEGTGSAPTPKRTRNKQRVLLLSSRGINHRMRHLMNDIEALLPHVKKGGFLSITR